MRKSSYHFKMDFTPSSINSTGMNSTLQFRKSNSEHDINAFVVVIVLLVELLIAFGIVVVHKRRHSCNR